MASFFRNLHMKTSTIFASGDLREWRKPRFEPRMENFASTQETLLLLRAFCAIKDPLVRNEIIRTAEKEAFPGSTPPPENAT